jgi:hypothetical protein
VQISYQAHLQELAGDDMQHSTTNWLARWHEMTQPRPPTTPSEWLDTVIRELSTADGPSCRNASIDWIGWRKLTMRRNSEGYSVVATLIKRPHDIVIHMGADQRVATSLDDLRAKLAQVLTETAAKWDRESLVA